MHFRRPSINLYIQDQTEEQLKRQGVYSNLIQQVVNLGTHVLDCIRESVSKKINNEKKLVVFVFFRRIVELLDSIGVQLRAGCVVPSLNNLRILFEAVLQLEYFLKDPELIPLKYKHYLIMDLDERIAFLSKFKDTLDAYKQFPNLDELIAGYQSDINKAEFNEIREEYKKKVFKNNGERKMSSPKWYHFAGGPENIWKLAGAVNKEEDYTIIYNTASMVTHSAGLIMDGLRTDGELSYIVRIKEDDNLRAVSRSAFLLGFEVLNIIGKQLDYEDRFKYLQERDEFIRANRKEINDIVPQRFDVLS